MKKLFYVLLVTVATSFAFVSCTEEEVNPKELSENGGGNVIETKSK